MQTRESPRYELKILVNSSTLPRVRSWLRIHRAGFNVSYPRRQVNNAYFDTLHLKSFAENLSGVTTRRKVRLRWYGENRTCVMSVFEVKCKRNMKGWKVSQPLSNPLNLETGGWYEIIDTIHNELSGDIRVHLTELSSPVLINQYQREYYTTFDQRVRVTLDYSHTVYDQRYSAYPNLKFPAPPKNDVVVEFKASTEHHQRLIEVVTAFPLRVGKYSKYVQGVEGLLGY